MKGVGRKVGVGGFIAQGLAGLAMGIVILTAGETLMNATTEELAASSAAQATAVLDSLMNLGFLTATAGVLVKFLTEHSLPDLVIGIMMMVSAMILTFVPEFSDAREVVAWLFVLAMTAVTLKRKEWTLAALMGAALALQIFDGTISTTLLSSVGARGLFSGVVTAYICGAEAAYVWKN